MVAKTYLGDDGWIKKKNSDFYVVDLICMPKGLFFDYVNMFFIVISYKQSFV